MAKSSKKEEKDTKSAAKDVKKKEADTSTHAAQQKVCLLYTSPSPRD